MIKIKLTKEPLSGYYVNGDGEREIKIASFFLQFGLFTDKPKEVELKITKSRPKKGDCTKYIFSPRGWLLEGAYELVPFDLVNLLHEEAENSNCKTLYLQVKSLDE